MAARSWTCGVCAALLTAAFAVAEPIVPLRREVSFEFKGKTVTLTLALPAAEFEKYGDLPHTSVFPLSYQMALARHDRVAQRVVAAARFVAERNGWGERDLAQLLLFIAQYVPYNYDSDHMVGDYVRYPGETFFMTGDCEDKSLLAHALLSEAGFESILVTVYDDDGGHAFVGLDIKKAKGDDAVAEGGQRFVLTEVSAPRWRLGQVGDEHTDDDLVLHRTEAAPRTSLPRSFENLALSREDLYRPDLASWIDLDEPTVVRISAARQRVAVKYPSVEIAREVLRFFKGWEQGLSPYYVDSEVLRSVGFRQNQVELRWE
ncbi:MAG: transglutaminase-like cysteine peptidase [bacterium]|nr:transglutaminase-like cysteine peptidase [bacterium]